MKARPGLYLIIVLSFAHTMSAAAGEFCVTCTGPGAVYRCSFPGSNEAAGVQLTCIGELARQGGHQSCTIDRNRQAPCAGVLKEIAAPDGPSGAPPEGAAADGKPQPAEKEAVAPDTPPPAASPPAGHAADTGVPEAAPPAAAPEKKEKPPRTVKEMVEKGAAGAGKSLQGAGEAVGDAAKSAGDAAEKTGSAFGNAAKKTWKCLTSLFSDC